MIEPENTSKHTAPSTPTETASSWLLRRLTPEPDTGHPTPICVAGPSIDEDMPLLVEASGWTPAGALVVWSPQSGRDYALFPPDDASEAQLPSRGEVLELVAETPEVAQ